jgi:hypothetical protein
LLELLFGECSTVGSGGHGDSVLAFSVAFRKVFSLRLRHVHAVRCTALPARACAAALLQRGAARRALARRRARPSFQFLLSD